MSRVTERLILANGLAHHVVEWGERAAVSASRPTTFLCHGYLDVAWSFRPVAEALAADGRHVVAFDWRGHGQSAWVPPGGYYHFPDYIRDLAELVDQLVPASEQIDLVGHSMGGTASALYAGTLPSRVRRLVLVEGLGPSRTNLAEAPDRMRAWFRGLDTVRAKKVRPMASLDEAVTRMRRQNPELSDELGRFLASKSTRPEGDGLVWSFDPLHQTTAPMPFVASLFLGYLAQITAMTMLVDGERGFRPDDYDARRAALRAHELITIPGVGHMVHWFAPDALVRELVRFLAP